MAKKTVFILSVDKLDEEYAILREICGTDSDNSIFKSLGKYEGNKHYFSPEEVKIYTGFDSEGNEYKISRIQDCAFSNCCDLVNLIIGPYVEEIGWNMYRCDSLMNIIVDKDNPVFSDKDGVLFNGTELVAFPQGRVGHYKVPEGTKKIGRMAFKSCSLSSITFPNTVEEIGINSFYECNNITEFILPISIKRIHNNCNIGHQPIRQAFYLYDDLEKKHPFSITEIIKMFPA